VIRVQDLASISECLSGCSGLGYEGSGLGYEGCGLGYGGSGLGYRPL